MYFLLTSPHPDDDICGLGDYIQHLNIDIGVWFLTNGNDNLRKTEAENALSGLGIKNIFWNALPFYNEKHRKITEKDINICRKFLQKIKPTTIAICYDADPNLTHVKCFQILQQATKNLLNVKIILYKSVWHITTIYPKKLNWIKWIVKNKDKKENAVLCHKSQLKLKVNDGYGSDLLSRSNLAVEKFVEIDLSTFKRLPVCLPNLKRRTVFTKDIERYVLEHFIIPLKTNKNIIFPTGNTPLQMYKMLKEQSNIPNHSVFQLDEYLNSNEYQEYLKSNLPSNFKFHFINAFAENIENECKRHDALCQNIDLTILGIGTNGHIAFNEPHTTTLMSPTRLVTLEKKTVEDNATKFTKAITLGIQTILRSKQIVLMAKRNKREILDKIFTSSVTVPATYLQYHPNVVFVVEE